MFDAPLRELRYAGRLLVRSPGTSGLVLGVLGLALAGNITLFSIIDTAFFKPAALPSAERSLNIYTLRRDAGHGGLSLPDFRDLSAALRETGACDEVFGYSGLMATASIEGQRPENVFGEMVTANYFSGTAAPMVAGSGFLAPDDRPGHAPRVVIGHKFWQRRFGGRSDVVGQTIRLNGLPFAIAGIAAPGFGGLLFSGLAADVWVPVAQLERFRGNIRDDRGERWLFVRGRLRDGAIIDQARAAADMVATRLASAYPDTNADRSFRMLRTTDVLVNPEADVAIRPLAASVLILGVLVLAIAAANVASVLVARMARRRTELAVRLSLGATRRELTRLVSLDAMVLTGGALAIGLSLARAALSALETWQPALPVPLGWTFALDGRVVAFGVALTLVTVALVSILPAWRLSRVDPLATLRGVVGSPLRRRIGRESLLVPQIALSLVLLVVAGLFARSLQRAASIDPGFSASGTAVMALNLGLSGYDEPRAARFWATLVERLRADSGIAGAAITDRIPMDLYGSQSATIAVERSATPTSMQIAHVGEGYFETLGIPLRAGSVAGAFTTSGGTATAVVSESAARELWPGEPAIGQRLRVGEHGEWRLVSAVVGDVQLLETLGESGAPLVYVPMAEGHTQLLRVAVSGRPGVADLERRLEAAARAVDPDVAIFETRRLSEHLDTTMLPFRAAALVSLAAGAFGLLLTIAGVAGSVSQAVVGRAREIGIRVALGGSGRDVAQAVAAPAIRSTVAGLVLGGLGSLAAAQAVAGFLFGVAPLDPIALTVVPLVVIGAVLAAALAPIRRALTLNPSAVLRDE